MVHNKIKHNKMSQLKYPFSYLGTNITLSEVYSHYQGYHGAPHITDISKPICGKSLRQILISHHIYTYMVTDIDHHICGWLGSGNVFMYINT